MYANYDEPMANAPVKSRTIGFDRRALPTSPNPQWHDLKYLRWYIARNHYNKLDRKLREAGKV